MVQQNPPVWKKLGWFALLWVAGVSAVALLGYLVKWIIPEY